MNFDWNRGAFQLNVKNEFWQNFTSMTIVSLNYMELFSSQQSKSVISPHNEFSQLFEIFHLISESEILTMSLSTVTYRTDEFRNLYANSTKTNLCEWIECYTQLTTERFKCEKHEDLVIFSRIILENTLQWVFAGKNVKILVLILKSNYKRIGDLLFWQKLLFF